MSLIKLYLDEDAQATGLTFAFRQHVVNVLTTNEAGMNENDDEQQLEYAASVNRILYTYNGGDFQRLHHDFIVKNKTHAGIIIGEQERFGIGEQVRRILVVSANKTAEAMLNNLEFLSNWK